MDEKRRPGKASSPRRPGKLPRSFSHYKLAHREIAECEHLRALLAQESADPIQIHHNDSCCVQGDRRASKTLRQLAEDVGRRTPVNIEHVDS